MEREDLPNVGDSTDIAEMADSEVIRIGVVDDHELVRDGLALLLQRTPGLEVAWTAGGVREAERLLERSLPDLVLTDLSLDDGNGTELVRTIRRARKRCPVVVMTGFSDRYAAAEALRQGVAGYVLKNQPTAELVTALQTVGRGGRYMSPALPSPEEQEKDGPSSGFAKLSRRENEIFRLVVKGCTAKEIARRLFISVKTVETHRTNINRKLDVRTTADLIRFAAAQGIEIAPRAVG